MILIVDNHDPFSIAGLETILTGLGVPYVVKDRTTPFEEVAQYDLNGVILSGGSGVEVDEPMLLSEIGLDLACLTNLKVPILGICMGYEIIVTVCGGDVQPLDQPIPSDCVEEYLFVDTGIFRGVPSEICMLEFNTLHAVSVPEILEVTARSARSGRAAVFHRDRPIYGTQFHPETSGPDGAKIIDNFVEICLADVRRNCV